MFIEKHKAYYEVLTQSGGRLGAHPQMILDHLDKMGVTPTDLAAVMDAYEEAMELAEHEFIVSLPTKAQREETRRADDTPPEPVYSQY